VKHLLELVPGDSAVSVVARFAGAASPRANLDTLISWLHAMSFASLRHRYVYVGIPKAACTTLKSFIAGLEHATCQLDRKPYLPVTKLEMRIHQRRYVGVPTLVELSGSKAHSILSGNSGFFIFSLVRNPFSRLVAAFEHRIRLCEPGFGDPGDRRWTAAEPGDNVRDAFAGFVGKELPNILRKGVDHHFVPQWHLLARPVIPYTEVFQIERFNEFQHRFIAHLRSVGALRIPEFVHRNRSRHPDWRHYYDRQTADRVVACYESDFISFGYDPESWRTDEPVPDMRTTPDEAYWRMEVIERNEMMGFLHRILSSRSEN
jgi:hypothetical protein